MANDPSQEIDLQAQISSALARRSGRQPGTGGDARMEPTLGLGGMGPGSERAAPKQQSLLDDEPVGEIPPAPIHFQRDGDDHHVPRQKLQQDSKIKKHRNLLFFLLPVVGVPAAILIALFLYLAIEMQGEGVQDSAPLIAAPQGPDKVKPTNEGGLAVEGMDSAVLNQTANNQTQTTTEQLLPPPEEPLTPPAGAQTPPTATAGDGTAATDGTAAAAVPSVEVPLTPPAAAVPTASQATTSAVTTATTATNNATTTASSATTTTAPATTQTAAAGIYRVQLVALKSEDAAKSAWTTFQKKYSDLLTNMTLNIDKIDLGGNGIFYRVQAGPLTDRAAANDLCGKLGQRGQSCIVVKP